MKKHKGGIAIAFSDKIYYLFGTIVLTFVMIVVAYPLYFTLIASISDPNAVSRGEALLWPAGIDFGSYRRVFSTDMVLIGYRNSLFYTVLSTVLSVSLTTLCGYALSVKFAGRRFIMFMIVVPMFFGGGIIPVYFIYKYLGLLNTIWVIILPSALSSYNLIITRTFIGGIPIELYEASQIDGCSRFRYFFSVVVPLSTVIMAVIALFNAVGQWNSYFNALMFLNDKKLHPLQLVLRDILIMNSVSVTDNTNPEVAAELNRIKEMIKYALIIVASFPMLILYPFLQRYFVKGVLIGSIKG